MCLGPTFYHTVHALLTKEMTRQGVACSHILVKVINSLVCHARDRTKLFTYAANVISHRAPSISYFFNGAFAGAFAGALGVCAGLAAGALGFGGAPLCSVLAWDVLGGEAFGCGALGC